MSFVHPLFLWALTTLAIPVVIHLFNFRRTRKVYFSNIRLLELVQEASSRKRKIQHLLVLFSRLLFLFFLVMAFAQPYLPAAEGMGSGKDVVVYIDNSPSMSIPMPDKTRALEQAVAYGKSIVDLFPRDTRYLILTNDFSGASNFKSSQETLEQLAAIRSVSQTRSFQDVLRKVNAFPSADVFFISDFQRSAVGPLTSIDSIRKIGLIPVQPKSNRNVYVDSAAFENPYLIAGEKSRLTLWLRNDSRELIEQLTVRLTIGKALASMTTVSVEPLGVTPVYIDVMMSDKPVPMQVTLQDFPVVYDNEFFLTAHPLPRIQILHVYGGKLNPFIPGVFGNTGLFQLKSQSLQNISYDLLEKADLIVLEEITKVNKALSDHLLGHPNQNILIIPTNESEVTLLSTLTGVQVSLTKNPVRLPLSTPEKNDPFFENVFEDRERDFRMPEATPLVKWGNDRSAILQFKDGTPMLSRFGRTYLMASSLSTAYSDLATHALFVPVMYRIAAASRTLQSKPYHFLKKGLVALSQDTTVTESPLRLKGVIEVVPSQRLTDGKWLLDLPADQLIPGTYAALRGQDTVGLVSLNIAREESKMDYLTAEDLLKSAQSLKNATVFEAGSVQAFSKGIKERYLGVPLWKYCLALSLFFLLAEVLLLRLFHNPPIKKAEAVQPT